MKASFQKKTQRTGLSILRAVLISFLFFISGLTYGQFPGWTMAKTFGASGYPYISSNAVNSSGSLYTLGAFSGELDIDPGPDTNIVISESGSDLFITKQNEEGDLIWGRTIIGTDLIKGTMIAVGLVRGENIYVTGSFTGTVDFDPGPSEFLITSTGLSDIFILKLDADGNFVWAKRIGGSGTDETTALAIDPLDGFVYSTGSYEATVDFDPGQLSFLLTVVNARDIFISKLDENGNFIWAKTIGAEEDESGSSIAVDPIIGDVYVGGWFGDDIDFDPGSGIYTMNSENATFLLKLNSSGIFAWAKQFESTSIFGRSIGIDPNEGGSIYMAGYFHASTDLDPNSGVFLVTSSGWSDLFILKLELNGNFIWAKQIGGNEIEFCNSIAVPNGIDDGIYLTGEFVGSCDFDPGNDVLTLTSTGQADIFILHLSGDGEFMWANAMGTSIWDGSLTIAVDNFSVHGPYIAGIGGESMDADPGPDTFTLANGVIFNISFDTTGQFEWANTWISDHGGFATGRKIAMDPISTKSVSVGFFGGKIDFDPGEGIQIKIAEGPQDLFITNLDSLGQWLWTKSISTANGYIDPKALRLDPFDQSIYLTGQFEGLIDFDPGTGIENVTAPAFNYLSSTFILKLSATGEFLWLITFVCDLNGITCISNDMAVDASGHLYITGSFSYGPIDFDPGTNEFFLSSGEYSGFVLKLDTLGNFKWANKIGMDVLGFQCSTGANSIAVLPKNEAVYITGVFAGSCYLDESNTYSITLPGGGLDLFIIKTDSSGITEWAKTIGDPYGSDEVVTICTDRNSEKNIYVLGRYAGQVDFDPGPGTHIVYTNNGAYDIFLLKLDSTGGFVWVDGFGGPNSDGPSDMTVDTVGQFIYLTGFFLDSMDANPGFGYENLVSHGDEDIFLISVDHTGDLHHAEAIGTPWQDWLSGISRSSGARFMLTGTFDYPSMTLDTILMENEGAPGSQDAFIARYDGCPGVVTNTFDDGFGSLRRIIACSSPEDTIVFDLTLPNAITLTSGEIVIDKNLTIEGPGVDQLSISANNLSRIFNLDEGYVFGIKNLTLKEAGFPSLGGAMLIQGHAILENVKLKQNHQNGLPKAVSLVPPGILEVAGNVEIKY